MVRDTVCGLDRNESKPGRVFRSTENQGEDGLPLGDDFVLHRHGDSNDAIYHYRQ